MSDPAVALFDHLRRATAAVERGVGEDLASTHGISLQAYLLLSQLHALGGTSRPSDLSRALGVHKSTITRTVDHLEAERLVSRTHNEADNRIQHVSLTPDGRAMVRNLSPIMQRLVRRHLAKKLSESDLNALARALPKLI